MRYSAILSLATAISIVRLGAGANPLPQDATPNSRVSKNTLAGCLQAAKAPLTTSSSADWADQTRPYNARVSFAPAAVVIATEAGHVQAAVRCGAQYGYKVTGRGGGHSYSSSGMGGENGHVVVRLDQMYAVTLQADNTAVVQAGARLGHVATELLNQGGRAISHGSCPGVGVSGHVLHGGYGLSSHMYGLALDWVLEVTVVVASGKIVKASATQNPDLFWALRGAGSSFGIVTEFKFNTFEAPDTLTVFKVPVPLKNQQKIVNMLVGYQKYTRDDIPAELNIQLVVGPDSMGFGGMYYGGEDDVRSVLTAFLQPLGVDASAGTYEVVDWMGQLEHNGGTPLDITGPEAASDNFYASSLATKEVPREAFKAFVDYLQNKAKTVQRGWFVLIDVHGGANSKTAQIDAASTAYAHRDKLFLWQFYDSAGDAAYPANARQGTDFVKNWMATVSDRMTAPGAWGRYANYQDPLLPPDVAQNQYYMSSLARLRSLKAQYDPKGLFTYPQGVQA
ncbi:glucooligosaccharide oxidase [Colletotrichum sojae]|uniref:Glucooligosaccharide oxidase n=1 Tax=Colletotrichum sojae TaxID=2175907 RepID=A0A8H6ITF2_9PEZI|nr:glucooligosaccharide oxidase [Colletotrichum sojae]